MGKHLVPQAYLRQFTLGPSSGIHVFDLKTGDWRADGRPLPVGKVAQLADVWCDDIEAELTHIEQTGFPVVRRLANESDIVLSDHDRAAATCYIVSLRGVRSVGVWSDFKPLVVANLKKAADADDVPGDEERARIEEWFNKERQEVEKGPYRDRSHSRGEMAPWISPGAFSCISAMRWTVLCAEGGAFITTDAPVRAFGLELREGRAWMPLSPKRLLLMDWASDKHVPSEARILRWMPCRQVSHYNRLMAAAANRELYCREPYGWVKQVARDVVRDRVRHRGAGSSARARRDRGTEVGCVECGLSIRHCGCSLGVPYVSPDSTEIRPP